MIRGWGVRKTGMGWKKLGGSLDGPKKSERLRRLEISKDKGAKVLKSHLLEILLLFCGNFLALHPPTSPPHASQGLRAFLAFPFSLFLLPCPHLVHPRPPNARPPLPYKCRHTPCSFAQSHIHMAVHVRSHFLFCDIFVWMHPKGRTS